MNCGRAGTMINQYAPMRCRTKTAECPFATRPATIAISAWPKRRFRLSDMFPRRNGGLSRSRRPARDDQVGDEGLDDLVVLVDGLNFHPDESPVGPRHQGSDLQNLRDDV